MISASTGPSPPMIAFPLSMQAGGGLRIMGLKKIVFEVEWILEEEGIYPSPVLLVGHFSSVILSNYSCVSNNFSSRS